MRFSPVFGTRYTLFIGQMGIGSNMTNNRGGVGIKALPHTTEGIQEPILIRVNGSKGCSGLVFRLHLHLIKKFRVNATQRSWRGIYDFV